MTCETGSTSLVHSSKRIQKVEYRNVAYRSVANGQNTHRTEAAKSGHVQNVLAIVPIVPNVIMRTIVFQAKQSLKGK